MLNERKVLKTKRKKITIALSVAFLVSTIVAITQKYITTGDGFRPETLMYALILFLNALFTGSLAYYIIKRFSGKTRKEFEKAVIPTLIFFIFIALLISLVIVSLGVFIFFLVQGLDMSNFLPHLFNVELTSAIKQFSGWILIGSIFFFYILWRKAITQEHILQEENLKFQYQTLKSQINPHFLFNSLNTLSALVYEDAKKADHYVQKLSHIYRFVLDIEDKNLISLNQEIAFVEEYFDLQKVRDAEKIFLEIDIETPERYMIVPMSAQSMVENALKHNSASRNSPLNITICRENHYLVVRNNVQRKNIMEPGSGKGLKNLKKRINLILSKELLIAEINKEFIAKVPITERKYEGTDH